MVMLVHAITKGGLVQRLPMRDEVRPEEILARLADQVSKEIRERGVRLKVPIKIDRFVKHV